RQWGNRVLTPHAAATPRSTMKLRPIILSAEVLLLQAWSTAVIQTTNRRIAPAATTLSHIVLSSWRELVVLRPSPARMRVTPGGDDSRKVVIPCSRASPLR